MSARDEIIGRIRAAQSNLPAPTQHEPAFRRHWDAERPEILERFVQRLSDYHVTVLHAPTEAHIASVAERQLASRGIASLVIPADLPAGWRPSHPAPIEDIGLAFEDLDAVAGVMTGSLLGIAETGTVVLNAGVAQGRRALTLLPDYHLCVVRAAHVVGIMPEAIAALAASVARASPITFFSGPSATADIELDRVEGVHGPRTLDVILVD